MFSRPASAELSFSTNFPVEAMSTSQYLSLTGERPHPAWAAASAPLPTSGEGWREATTKPAPAPSTLVARPPKTASSRSPMCYRLTASYSRVRCSLPSPATRPPETAWATTGDRRWSTPASAVGAVRPPLRPLRDIRQLLYSCHQ